ncbi:MAG: hypothetical protein ACFFBH_07015 [Promethearchaeota archaeon]
MNLKRNYRQLYQHWLKEFEEPELTILNQEIFNNYKKLITNISSFQLNKADNIKSQLFKDYKVNLDFLFKDLLKIREKKIINAALANKDINLEHVLESEKLLYQNLISTFKGYKKVKNLYLSKDYIKLQQESLEEVLESNLVDEIDIKETEKVEPNEVSPSRIEKIEEEINYNYTLIRFLKKAEALVGIDLINYGPFEKNDIANLPYKNAVILINEKLAEKIDVT